jgi:ATP-binding cassette, subfamily C, bacterial CydD
MTSRIRRGSAGSSPPVAETRLLALEPAAGRHQNLAVVAGFGASAAVLAAAWLMADVVAEVFLGGATLASVAPKLEWIAVALVLRAGLSFASDVLAQRSATRLKGRLRSDLTARLFDLGPTWAAGQRTGELATVLAEGLDAVDAWLTTYRPARALAVAVPLLVLAVVFVVDPPTTLVLLFTGPILLLLLAVIGGRVGAITARRFAERRWLSAYFLDMLRGLATLKLFGRSREQVGTMRSISRRYGDTTMEVLRTAFQTGLVLDWGAAVAMALVAVQVGLRLLADAIPFDRALAVLIITPEFFLPLRTLATRYHAGTAGRAAAERIAAILDEPGPSPRGGAGGRAPQAGAGEPPPTLLGDLPIAFDHVTVTYAGRSVPALADVDLTIAPRRTTAVVGPTGAGKSTLASVLLRFVEPSAGAVRVGDVDLAAIDPAAWRARLAWLPQLPHLFHGSVGDNLRLARPDATEAELVAAARVASALEFIEALPGGFDAPIGEGGLRLSGGQRQRLALARAFLREAPIVVLDEPTADLDPDAETAIAEAIGRLAADRTVLLITHRAELARGSDDVVELSAAGGAGS